MQPNNRAQKFEPLSWEWRIVTLGSTFNRALQEKTSRQDFRLSKMRGTPACLNISSCPIIGMSRVTHTTGENRLRSSAKADFTTTSAAPPRPRWSIKNNTRWGNIWLIPSNLKCPTFCSRKNNHCTNGENKEAGWFQFKLRLFSPWNSRIDAHGIKRIDRSGKELNIHPPIIYSPKGIPSGCSAGVTQH